MIGSSSWELSPSHNTSILPLRMWWKLQIVLVVVAIPYTLANLRWYDLWDSVMHATCKKCWDENWSLIHAKVRLSRSVSILIPCVSKLSGMLDPWLGGKGVQGIIIWGKHWAGIPSSSCRLSRLLHISLPVRSSKLCPCQRRVRMCWMPCSMDMSVSPSPKYLYGRVMDYGAQECPWVPQCWQDFAEARLHDNVAWMLW